MACLMLTQKVIDKWHSPKILNSRSDRAERIRRREKSTMFFVRGLSSKGKEVFVNPDQVLYVRPVGKLGKGTELVLTHGERLTVDQDAQTVGRRFEEYLKEATSADDDDASGGADSAELGSYV